MYLFSNQTFQKKTKKKMNPPQILVIGFATLIFIGALLLMQPISTVDNNGLSLIDALFTSTSAVCVTGLIVVDTGTHFTQFGQIIILFLIQIGGLGFMTIASLFAILLGKKITLKERLLLQEALNQVSLKGIVRLTIHIILCTFFLEFFGALILASRWSNLMGWPKALFYGLFHSVSAFNNAGFDLMGNFSSLTQYANDPIINIIIGLLIILGGLGFFVLVEIINKRNYQNLSLHSKLVLSTSFVLILIGFVTTFIFEYSNTLIDLSIGSKIMASFFQSITARTAGFNTIDTSSLKMATQFFIIILMFIGASPGSTGGGIKTTTFASIFLYVKSTFRGDCQETIFERSLHKEVIRKSIAITFVSICLVFFSTLSLLISEQQDFLSLLFEATSAFGTVGLSTGITPVLSIGGKITILLTMFAGRVGPLTLVFALGNNKQCKGTIKYVEEKVMIG